MPKILAYDPLDPAVLENPYPVYATLRSAGPIFWHERMHCWVLTHYRDCQAVLRNNGAFASDWRRIGKAVPEPQLGLQLLDPPDHGPLRSLFTNALRAQDLAGLTRRAERTAESLLDAATAGEDFDMIHRVIAPLALGTVSDLVGTPCPPVDLYDPISDAIVRSMDAGLDPSVKAAGVAARARLNELVDAWFAADPRPGLLSEVTRTKVCTDLPESYIRNTMRIVFQSGYSSIVAGAGNMMLALLEHPGSIERMRDPKIMSTGFEELMRYDSAVQGTSRAATKTTLIRDTVVAAGDIVLMLFGSANRDPAEFPNPDTLLLDRSPNKHLSFGRGPHSCIGNLFTKIVLQALIRTLLRHPSTLQLVGSPIRKPTATVRSLAELPVRFVPAVG
ncbi:cytochrome P450 [Nocardia sp. NPDC052316]|uniref:cytochrome P450 n=1 Tax=Nocardia sp. NPDC052316 TaxID=3364329 RepID=UPI0037C89E80